MIVDLLLISHEIIRFLIPSSFLDKYSYKFIFVAFLGIHIPLPGILAYVVSSPGSLLPALTLILLTLALTLLATGLTLLFLSRLLSLIQLANSALRSYLKDQILSYLPLYYQDEVGNLLQDIQNVITRLDAHIGEQKDVTGILSHDFRSPATSLLGILSILKEDVSKRRKANVYLPR